MHSPIVFCKISVFGLYYDFLCSFSGGGYSGNQENRYVGFGNTVTPEKKEDDFINNAMSSIYSVGQDIHLLAELYILFCSSSPVIVFSFFFSAGLEQFHCWCYQDCFYCQR